MRQQTELAIEEADVVLFLIDAREGITPGDEIFAQLLRLTEKPVILGRQQGRGQARRFRHRRGLVAGLRRAAGRSPASTARAWPSSTRPWSLREELAGERR